MTVVVPVVPFGQGRIGQVRHARSLVDMADTAHSAGERKMAELLIARAYAAYDRALSIPTARPPQTAWPKRIGQSGQFQDENIAPG